VAAGKHHTSMALTTQGNGGSKTTQTPAYYEDVKGLEFAVAIGTCS
jgi:hypothetical protein